MGLISLPFSLPLIPYTRYHHSPDIKDIHDVALAPDGNVMATAGGDGIVKFWNVACDSNEPVPK